MPVELNDLPPGFAPLDPGRVNPMDPIEMQYWCRELGCTPAALTAAVGQVGEHVAAVRDHLESRPQPPGLPQPGPSR